LAAATIALAATGAATHGTRHGDAKAGEAIYSRCLGCHALEYDRTGPRHCGLIGRRAGSVEDFPYSEAMKRSPIIWSERSLDRFLANPPAVVPGTRMGYAGTDDARERADLIAYLVLVNASAACKRSSPTTR
jgi:cytochrome c